MVVSLLRIILFIKNFANYNHTINIGFTGIIGVFFLIIISIASHIFFKHGIVHNIVILIIAIQLIIGGLVNYEVLSINEKFKFLFAI